MITQFLAFTYLYYVDARAARRGWAPYWYGTYRFVLTFVVGASIIISLIGRGQITGQIGHSSGPASKIKALKDSQLGFQEQEEEDRKAKVEAEIENEDKE